jgi:hypothetical protein
MASLQVRVTENIMWDYRGFACCFSFVLLGIFLKKKFVEAII